MFSSSRNTLPHVLSRPPTPPLDTNESIEEAIAFLNSDITLEKEPQLISQISSSTPPSSSPLRPQTQICHVSVVKRVEFLSTPTFHPPPNTTLEAASPKSSPARSKLLRPSKSILKLGSVSPLPTPEASDPQSCYFPNKLPETFAKMLESTLRQLESASRYSRLDAYLAINGALMTYDDQPDRQEMRRHMNAFQRLILRDIALRELDETTDVQIAVQAFKLAARILAYDDFLQCTDSDFQTSIVDRSLAVIEHSSMPKTIVKCVLGLLAQQDLPSTVLTSVRMDRALTALQTIDVRCQGNSVVAIRITIYRRFIRQGQSVMLARMRDWLQHVLDGMLSEVGDVRGRAIEACSCAALEFGTNASATKALHDLLEAERDEGSARYFEHFTLRLAQLTKNEGIRSTVPLIWSALILFHRSSKMPIHTWRRFRSWLTVMEPCLCSSDSELRCQAHSAWRKLIYVVRPDSSMPASFVTLLMVPMRTGFERTGADKRSKELRRLALDGYYNLLHYALRPDLSFENLDFAWKSFVVDTISVMASASTKGRHFAGRILRGLFTPNSGIWNPAAALENTAILPEDLPRLDVRWVRSRLSKILPMIDVLLLPMLRSTVVEHYTLASTMWSSLVQSVVQAGAQEVRMSTELRAAIVEILNCFRRLTLRSMQPSSNSEDSIVQARLAELQITTLKQLGVAHSMEDFIVLDPSTKEARLTQPLHSPSSAHRGVVSPLAFVLSYAASVSHQLVQYTLSLVLSTKVTHTAKVQLMLQTWQTLSTKPECIDGDIAILWQVMADTLLELLDQVQVGESTSPEALQTLGACKAFLASSCYLVDADMRTVGVVERLTERTVELAKHIAGEAGPTIAMIEPLSKMLLTEGKSYDLQVASCFATAILRTFRFPHQPRAEGQAIKALIGVAGIQISSSFTHEHFLTLIDKLLRECYERPLPNNVLMTIGEATELVCRLSTFTSDHVASILTRLQPSLSICFEDVHRRLAELSKEPKKTLSQSWDNILSLLKTTSAESVTFSSELFGTLLATGFRSTSVEIVNNTIEFWNDTFEVRETESHSEELQQLLRALEAVAIIRMPLLTISNDGPVLNLPAFEGRENSLATPAVAEKISTPRMRSFAQRAGFSDRVGSADSPRPPRSSIKKLFKSPRIRHDDSQIEFIAIKQPPALRAQDSQLFTDNQREVRTRQSAEAQQYSEMSSSPIPLTHIASSALSQLASKQSVAVIEPASPDVPADMDMLDVHVASSPTPMHNDAQSASALSSESKTIMSSVAMDNGDPRQVEAQASPEDDSRNDHSSYVGERQFPYDADLPNMQLQLETEMAASVQSSPAQAGKVACRKGDTPPILSTPSRTTSERPALKRKRHKDEKRSERKQRRKTEEVLKFHDRDEDDMEDCIVVASSQQWVQSQSEENAPARQESNDVAEATPSTQSTPSMSQSKENPSSKGKRRGRRARRGQASQDDPPSSIRKQNIRIPATDCTLPSGRPSDRQAIVPMTDSQQQGNSTNIVEQTGVEITSSATSNEVAASPRRASMSAAGILNLLREALGGLKTSVFGQKEEREIDDMLFSLRQANHDAARRSDEMTRQDM